MGVGTEDVAPSSRMRGRDAEHGYAWTLEHREGRGAEGLEGLEQPERHREAG